MKQLASQFFDENQNNPKCLCGIIITDATVNGMKALKRLGFPKSWKCKCGKINIVKE